MNWSFSSIWASDFGKYGAATTVPAAIDARTRTQEENRTLKKWNERMQDPRRLPKEPANAEHHNNPFECVQFAPESETKAHAGPAVVEKQSWKNGWVFAGNLPG